MPNYVYNDIKIYGKEKDLDIFKNDVCIAGESVFSFTKLVPKPEDTSDLDDDFLPGWYRWGLRNWGTKWDCWDAELSEEKDHLKYKFITAWSPPFPIYDKLMKLYYQLIFDIVSYEPMNYWACELEAKNGEYTKIIEEAMEPLPVEPLEWGNFSVEKMICTRKDVLNNRTHVSIKDIFCESFPNNKNLTTSMNLSGSIQSNNENTSAGILLDDLDDDALLAELDNM